MKPCASILLALLVTTFGGQAKSAVPLPYGPKTCQKSFVFREAFTNDQVCVTPEVRQRVAQDNAAAASNVKPVSNGHDADTCKNGLVWRLARPQDHVCVMPQQQVQAADDNRLAYSRQEARLGEPRPASPQPHPHPGFVGDPPDYSGAEDSGLSESTEEPGGGGSAEAHCVPRMKEAESNGEGEVSCPKK